MPVRRRDVLLAIVLFLVVEAELLLERGLATDERIVSTVAGLGVLALAFRAARPLAATCVLLAALLGDRLAGGALSSLESPLVPVVVATFSLGAHAGEAWRAAAGTALAVGVATLVSQLAPEPGYSALDDLAFFVLVLGAPAAVGLLLGRRAEAAEQLRAHAEALRDAQAEVEAAAAAEERALVALGLHQALADRVAEIAIQSEGAQRLAGADPARAREALRAAEDAARAALADIRRVVGVLRREDGPTPPAPPAPPEQPAPPPGARNPSISGTTYSGWRRAAGSGSAGAPVARVPRADVVLAAAIGVAVAIEVLTSSHREGSPVLNVGGVAAVAAFLAFRRRAPLVAAAGALVAATVHSLLLTPFDDLVTPIVLMLVPAYSVGAHLPLRRALAGLAICVAATAPAAVGPIGVAITVAAWAGGRAVHERGRQVIALREVTATLERARDARRDRARSEERLRIARELHDAVAHSMTVVVLQAGAARRVWDSDPDAARDAVAALADVARRTLGDLRGTLHAGDGAGERRGVDGLEALAARMRGLGLDVRLVRDGAGTALPPEVDHVAYRVVQEALTNALRHAGPTTVDVRLRHDGDEVAVDVVDAGRPTPVGAPAATVDGTGTGLRGMAERVAACGGELRYGPDGPGFGVHVRLPVAEVRV